MRAPRTLLCVMSPYPVPLGSIWTDLAVPVIIATIAAALAAFWPWLQARQRPRQFERIIGRELEELGPWPREPVEGKPWWEHLPTSKRFVHRDIFQEQSEDTRDLLLSLDANVIYEVNQLWAAFEARDGTQWLHFIEALAANRKLRSGDLRAVRDAWRGVMAGQPDGWLEPAASTRSEPEHRVPPPP
jgi:hypothetical protein